MEGKTQPLFDEGSLPLQPTPPTHFRRLPRRLEIDFCCPRCGYGWSGSASPVGDEVERELAA